MVLGILGALAGLSFAALALSFLPWEVAVPPLVLGYLGYKIWYYGRNVGEHTVAPEEDGWSPTGLLVTLGAYVLLVVVAVVLVVTLSPGIWTGSRLGFPPLPVRQPADLVVQVLVVLTVLGTELLALVVLAFGIGRFRTRLLNGVTDAAAARRAALWESAARLPAYALWATVFGLAFQWTVRALGVVFDFTDPVTSQFNLIFQGVFGVVLAVGHLLPLLVVGAYLAVWLGKYGDPTVPEAFGYRGLFAPDRGFALVNAVVPTGLFLLYSILVLGLNVPFFRVSLLDDFVVMLLLPVLAGVAFGADLRGLTTRLIRSPAGLVPGVGGDAVTTGLAVATYLLVPLLLLELVLGATRDLLLTATLLLPVFALPPTYVANRVFGFTKRRGIGNFSEAVEADPDSLDEGAVDRLFAYAEARDDDVRAAAIDGLASAASASAYRQDEAIDAFVAAVSTDDDQFAAPGLRGIVGVLRTDREVETLERLTSLEVLDPVEDHLDGSDPETRALAAEAFARIVDRGFGVPGVRRPDLSGLDGGIPVEAIETAVGDEPSDPQLASAVVRCFARLWYHRATFPDVTLSPADRQRILVDIFRWADAVDDVALGMATFAVTSDRAIVEEAGLSTVVAALDDEEPVVRYVAAHVVGSSMVRHAERVDPDRLFELLDDEAEPVRWAGAESLYAYVNTTAAGGREVASRLLDHLDERRGTAAPAEAAVLRTLELIDVEHLSREGETAEVVAAFVTVEDASVADPAARLLADLVEADPGVRKRGPVTKAIEDGLTHDSPTVREGCVDAAASIIAESPGDGRAFTRGLVLNLSAASVVGEMAVSALARVISEYPEYGTEFLPEMVGGLRNATPISGQYAGARLSGRTVSQVTAELLATVTDYDVSRGENLIEPLVDIASNADGATHEGVVRALSNLSAEYPEKAAVAVDEAMTAIDEGGVRTRRSAARLLANVAARDPESVEPVVSNLVVAMDDDDPRTRATAMLAVGNVGAAMPETVDENVRRVIGRLDDDSALVREHAAEVIVMIAENNPEVIQPAAETADRLRRLQRDPAIDIEGETLQAAATAVQTGTPPGEASGETAGDDTEVWSVEEAGQVGTSGDTRVFDPVADPDEDDEFHEDTCRSCGADLSDVDADECPDCGTEIE